MTFDLCLLVKALNLTNRVIRMQTNDTLILATIELANKEQAELRFLSKLRQELTTTNLIHFNSALVKLKAADGSIAITQARQIKKIELIKGPENYIA